MKGTVPVGSLSPLARSVGSSFGPVRSVKPELVMELAFEGIQHSNRHKSGIAVRFPRIARWRHDKRASDANSLKDLQALIPTSSFCKGKMPAQRLLRFLFPPPREQIA